VAAGSAAAGTGPGRRGVRAGKPGPAAAAMSRGLLAWVGVSGIDMDWKLSLRGAPASADAGCWNL